MGSVNHMHLADTFTVSNHDMFVQDANTRLARDVMVAMVAGVGLTCILGSKELPLFRSSRPNVWRVSGCAHP